MAVLHQAFFANVWSVAKYIPLCSEKRRFYLFFSSMSLLPVGLSVIVFLFRASAFSDAIIQRRLWYYHAMPIGR